MIFNNLGLTSYQEAYEIQKKTVQKVLQGGEDELIICSHNPVVTLGKKSTPEDLSGWIGEVVTIERGGKATYHGPGQVIIYPIINLRTKGQNIAGFLEAMEGSMIEVLNSMGFSARGNDERGKPDFTGVWVETPQGAKKIASIGVAVKRWISFHGLAFNLLRDPNAFKGISPCGFTPDTMISLEDLARTAPEREDFEKKLISKLAQNVQELTLPTTPHS